jgi:ribosomal small subunit protein bTHX
MGKGDMKTKKGKIIRKSYGKTRPKGNKSIAQHEADKKKSA